MGKRINIMVDEDTWRILVRIPVGTRNRAINDALRAWVSRRRRSDAVHELDFLRAVVPALWLYEVGKIVARRYPTRAGAGRGDAGEWWAACRRWAAGIKRNHRPTAYCPRLPTSASPQP